jgi:hypothetical protein
LIRFFDEEGPMRWIALLAAALVASALLLLLVLPPASALPVSGVRLDKADARNDGPKLAVQPAKSGNGHKRPWRRRCY